LLVFGAVITAAPAHDAVHVVGLAAVGAGTAVVWAKVHHRSLTLVPGRSATVSTVVGLLATPALGVPVAMGVVADSLSLTAALAGTAVLAVPLAVMVLGLGGGTVPADELDG
jgi:hypothetical protein